MAAVLCKSIGELCALPFRCCAAGCNGCTKACGPACKECGQLCDTFFSLLCRNPFSLFVAVALFTQGPCIFLFIPAIGGFPDCTESLYLVANAILAAVNVFTAFYLAYRIVDTTNQDMGDTAFKRALYLLCHDPWIAIYICLFIGFMCVQAWGSSLSFGNFFQNNFSDQDIPVDDQICPDAASSMIQIGTGLGWTFCFLGFMALLFSLCCAKFDHADYSQPANNTNNTNPSVPHGSAGYNAQGAPNNDFVEPGSAGYNAQGVPNNDFVQPQKQQGGKKDTKSSSSTPMYTQQGVPTNDFVAPNQPPPQVFNQARPPPQQEEIPMAYAQEIPQASAPPSQYDTPSGGASNAEGTTTTGTNNNNNSSSVGGKAGGTAGKQIGKLFTKDQAKQEKIAKQGEKAGKAVESGILAATKFVKSKMNQKKGNNASSGNNDSSA